MKRQKMGITDLVKTYQAIIRVIHQRLYGLGSGGSGFLKSLKAAMAIKGICQNILLPPYFPFDADMIEKVEIVIRELEAEYAILQD